jgi:hypothetical protein
MYEQLRDPYSASPAQPENFVSCSLIAYSRWDLLTILPFTGSNNILLQFSTSYLCKQAFSCSTSIKSKDRNRLISVEDELFVLIWSSTPKLSICAANNNHRFHIKEVNFILYFSFKNNTVLDDIFDHIALIYLMVSLTLLFDMVNKLSYCK